MYLPVLQGLADLSGAVSRETLWTISGIIAWVFCRLKLTSNEILERHREKIMEPLGLDASNFDIYQSMVAGYLDFLHLSNVDDAEFREVVKIRGSEHLTSALSGGKGCILITAHYSAWELAPRGILNQGHRVGIVYRELRNNAASKFLDNLRQRPGIESVDRDRGLGSLMNLLRQNAVVGILIDQDTMGADGEFVDFLGFPARTPTGPAKIALRFGIPILTLHMKREADNSYILVIDESIDTTAFSGETGYLGFIESLNKQIGEWIHDDPAQWVWIHKRWYHRPDGTTGLR